MTVAQARRYAADRLLSILPLEYAIEALDIPQSQIEAATDDARYARARAWTVDRLKQATKTR